MPLYVPPAEQQLIIWHPLGAPPVGHIKANGATLSRTAYAWLFSKIGTAYGVGDGATTFGTPDLRGEFLRGLDDGRGVDPGRLLGSMQADDFKSHAHESLLYQATGGGQAASNAVASGSVALPTTFVGGTETRPRNVAGLFCIRIAP